MKGSLNVDLLGFASCRRTKADGGKDSGGVETKTVESNVKGEPGPCCTEEYLAVLPLAEMSPKVSPRSLGQFCTLVVVDGVDNVSAGGEVSVNVLRSLFDVALDIHGVTRGLRNGQTEVKCGSRGDTSESNDQTPALVDGLHVGKRLLLDRVLESRDNDDGNNTRGDCAGSARTGIHAESALRTVTPALCGKHCSHHAATDPSGSELRSDHGRERVVAADAHSLSTVSLTSCGHAFGSP